MTTTAAPASTARTAPVGGSAVPRHVYALSIGLAVVAAVSTALTFFVPDVLTGPAAANGNARGTALVMLVAAVPMLAISMRRAAAGSWRSHLVWLGSLAYLLYNAVLLVFLTPLNRLFLPYLATLSLAFFAGTFFVSANIGWAPARELHRLPHRGLAAYVWVLVTLNALAWLRDIVPALTTGDPASLVEGTGVATNAIYVQDLALWLPAAAIAGWWLWRRRPLGLLLTGGWLVFAVLEPVGIAVDQWFGHRADPASPIASTSVIPALVALAVVGLVPLWFYLRPSGSDDSLDEAPITS